MIKSVLLFGDSHVACMAGCLTARDATARANPVTPTILASKILSFPDLLHPFHCRHGGDLRLLNSEADSWMRSHGGASGASIRRHTLWLFSGAFTTTLLLRSVDWRRFHPWRCGGVRTHALSDAAMEVMVLAHFRNVLTFLDDLGETGVLLAAVESPPPRSDDPRIGRLVPADTWRSVDGIARAVMRHALNDRGIAVVGSPLGAVLQDGEFAGFLRPDLCEIYPRDYHHANLEYGRMMVEEILKTCRDLDGDGEL